MRQIVCIFLLCLTSFAFCACSGNGCVNDSTGAIAAYTNFINTLRACSSASHTPDQACDKHKIWELLDNQTKSQFLDAYAALVRIDRIIETYFDPIEHQYMRSKTGSHILKDANINSYEALFDYIFHPDALVFDDNTESGVACEKSSVQNDNYVNIQIHYNGQIFPMIRESDQVWRTSGLMGFVNAALDPIFASEAAMTEYAKGNLADEMARRAKVRDYFFEQQEIKKQQSEQAKQ